jgi:transposase
MFLRTGGTQLKGWDEVIEIKRLIRAGQNVSEVARELGIDRRTVRKYRDLTPEDVAVYRARTKRRSRKVDDFEDWIRHRVEAMAEDGVINSQAIYEEIKRLGYEGSARTLRRYVSQLGVKPVKRRIFEPFETPPGHQAMVDLGESRKVRIGTEKRTLYLIALVLSHSRKKYAQWYDRPVDTEMFIEFHQRAFQVLEGIPHQMVYDQTKLAVLAEQYGEVDFNESFFGYANWCGFRTYICNKSDPQTKGKIEAVIRYIKRSFLPGRSFDSLSDLEDQWEKWLREVADVKEHETTGRRPLDLWKQERPYLQPLARQAFLTQPSYRIQRAYEDGFVKVLGNRYSVPSSHHGAEVKVRVTEERVEIRTLQEEPLYSHWRSLEKGKRFKIQAHYAKTYQVSTQELSAKLLTQYESPQLVAQLQLNFPRHFREQARQILLLTRKFDRKLVQEAIERILKHDCVSYRNLKKTVRYLASQQAVENALQTRLDLQAELPQDMGLEIRQATYYDELLEVEP